MGASLIPGTCFNSCGCFLPDLTRLATLQCGEARRSLFYLISRPDEAVKRENKFGLVIANKLRYNAAPLPGEVDEWFKSPPWKGGTGATLSRVRIPPSPPVIQQSSACKGAFLFSLLAVITFQKADASSAFKSCGYRSSFASRKNSPEKDYNRFVVKVAA